MTINGKKYYVTNNCGSSVYFATIGAKKVTIEWAPMTETNAYYSITIDNNTPQRLSIDDNEIILPNRKTHNICITTDGITENIGKWENGTGFALASVSVEKGRIIRQEPKGPIIAFFGDSITEGIRALGSSEDMGDTNSATASFPWFCCKELGAVPYFIGYGATGILSDGSFHKAIDALNYYYKDNPTKIEKIDAIVINYGTNDNDYTSEKFIDAYSTFLDELYKTYPDKPIFIMVPFNLSRQNEIVSIAKQNTFVILVDTSTWEGITYTDGTHPDVNGAQIAGNYLCEIIEKSLSF